MSLNNYLGELMNLKKISIFIFCSFLFFTSLQAQESKPSPEQALENLKQGNQRFVDFKTKHPNLSKERRELLKIAHAPFAVIVSCSDARVPPEIVFDQGLGDLFVVRSAGNTVDKLGIGSIEYAVAVLNARLIVVMGHGKCGAISAVMSGKALPGHIQDVGKSVTIIGADKSCTMKDKLDCAIIGNVEAVVEQLKNSQPILAPLVKSGELKIVGGYYDLETGRVVLN